MTWSLRNKWTPTARAPTPFKPKRKTCFFNELRKPASYYLCFVSRKVLLSADVPSIPHDWKDIQYQCLLRLRGVQLQEFLSKQADRLDTDEWCRRQLKNADPDSFSVALSVDAEVDHGSGVDMALPEPLRPQIVPSILDVEPEWKRFLRSAQPTDSDSYFRS